MPFLYYIICRNVHFTSFLCVNKLRRSTCINLLSVDSFLVLLQTAFTIHGSLERILVDIVLIFVIVNLYFINKKYFSLLLSFFFQFLSLTKSVHHILNDLLMTFYGTLTIFKFMHIFAVLIFYNVNEFFIFWSVIIFFKWSKEVIVNDYLCLYIRCQHIVQEK